MPGVVFMGKNTTRNQIPGERKGKGDTQERISEENRNPIPVGFFLSQALPLFPPILFHPVLWPVMYLALAPTPLRLYISLRGYGTAQGRRAALGRDTFSS